MTKTHEVLITGALIAAIAVGAFSCKLLWDTDKGVVPISAASQTAVTTQSANLTAATGQLTTTLGTANTVLATANTAIATIPQATAAVATLAGNLGATTKKLNAAIDLTTHRVDDDCPTPKQITSTWQHCGTLADINQTLGASRVVMERTGRSIDKFDMHEDELFAQEKDFYATSQDAAAKFDAIMSSADILPIIADLHKGMDTGDHMLDTFDRVETKETHCILYPGFKCIVGGLIVPGFQITGAAAQIYTAGKH